MWLIKVNIHDTDTQKGNFSFKDFNLMLMTVG